MFDSKFSPWLPIKDHYKTLVDQNKPDEPYWVDYAILIGIPIGSGVVVGLLLQLRDMQSYIGGVAILTALLFGMVVHVFQLRMQLSSNRDVKRDGDLAVLVDQLFANVNYAVVAGILATAVSMAAAVSSDDDGRINGVWSGIVVGLGVHLLLVVTMCIKRIRLAYLEISKLPRPTSV